MGNFSQSALTLHAGNTGLSEFWQHMIKERQENVIHANLSEISRQHAGCNMCAVVEHKVIQLQ